MKSDDSIAAVTTHDGTTYRGQFFIDSSANGNLASMAGADFQLGRSTDGAMQPATLTFRIGPLDVRDFGVSNWRDWDNIWTIERSMEAIVKPWYQARGITPTKKGAFGIPNREGTSLVFNQTRIARVDSTDENSIQAGREEGLRQMNEFWEAVKTHPALANASISQVSSMLGLREGRRIIGDYVLTEQDCIGEARYDDMVVACGYAVDIHNPDDDSTRMQEIPGSGYYHIPYRCLYSRNISNLFIGSRCISGTHEAHSSYRVIAPVASIGQAVGTAASIAIKNDLHQTREVKANVIREHLKNAGQFVEGL